MFANWYDRALLCRGISPWKTIFLWRAKSRDRKNAYIGYFLPPYNLTSAKLSTADSLHERVTRCMRLYARGRPASSEIFHFLGSRNIVNRPCERPTRLFIIIFCFFSLPSPPPFGFYKNRARINRGAKVSAISHHSWPRKEKKEKLGFSDYRAVWKSGQIATSVCGDRVSLIANAYNQEQKILEQIFLFVLTGLGGGK